MAKALSRVVPDADRSVIYEFAMDTYGHLFEGSDHDSAEKMERLFGEEPTKSRILTMPRPKRVADKTADKNTEARVRRASK